MIEPLHLLNLAWGFTTLLEVILLVFLFRRSLHRSHPAFSLYLLTAVLQSALVAWSSRHWGSQSMQYFDAVWASQAVVVCLRWLAVAEIARRVLAGYVGIWRLAMRILFVLGLIILVYSIAVSNNRWELMVLNADRAVELCIGTFIVGMFLFARYYRLAMTNLERRLAVGFCLYSCSWVINVSIFQSWRNAMGVWWDFFGIFSYIATLTVWMSAVRERAEAREEVPQPALSPEKYAEISQQLNSRLHLLNNRLNHLLRSEDSRP